MSQPINLNRVRKSRARAQAKAQADENAIKFGRTKAQKSRDQAETEKTKSTLDAHRKEP